MQIAHAPRWTARVVWLAVAPGHRLVRQVFTADATRSLQRAMTDGEVIWLVMNADWTGDARKDDELLHLSRRGGSGSWSATGRGVRGRPLRLSPSGSRRRTEPC
jgi:hypothetical protein